MATALEGQWLDTLKHSDMSQQKLDELVAVAGKIHARGLKVEKVVPFGIVRPEGLLLEACVTVGDLEELLHSLIGILTELPKVQSIEIFPRGIPMPTVFLARIKLR